MDWLLIITVSAYFAIFGASFILLFPLVRRFLSDNKKYERNLHYIVITRQVCIFLMPLMFALAFIGSSFAFGQLTPLILLGLSINVFWFLQMPQLTLAHIEVDYSVDTLNCFNKRD